MLVVLIILDGWGIAENNDHNAIFVAKTKEFDKLLKFFPSYSLIASGKSVGYAPNAHGNSEQGHLILGLGRTIDKINSEQRNIETKKHRNKETEKLFKNSLSEIISVEKLKQLYISETEKFINVSYFFSGKKDAPPPAADWVNIPSPVSPSFSKMPEMSAKEISKKVVSEIMADKYNFIVVNFANADMVAHEGDLAATVKAIQTVDSCLGEIVEIVLAKDGAVLITSDHGNAEEIRPLTEGEIIKPHTANPVPLIIAGAQKPPYSPFKKGGSEGGFSEPFAKKGTLADVAPTILKLFGIKKPRQMTGKSLV